MRLRVECSALLVSGYTESSGERNGGGGESIWESTKTRVPVFILHWGEAHGQQLPGMDYKKVPEEAGLEGTEASQRASAWERDAAESASHSWEVLQRSPLSIRLQGFGGQSCSFCTGCVVSR